MKLPELDSLRLLLLLHQYRSTTKVAEHLFMSQSSVSRSLQKLRDYFDDELFVRNSMGLIPTSKADFLVQRLPDIIEQLEQVMYQSVAFDPTRLNTTITIAINAFLAPEIGGKLLKRFHTSAPNVNIFIDHWDATTVDNLLSEKIDMGLNYYPLSISKQILQKKLARDQFVMLMHHDHPLDVDIITAEDAVPYPMAQLVINNFNESSYSDEAILSQGLTPNIKLKSSNLMLLLESLGDKNMVMPCSRWFAATVKGNYRYIPLADYPTNPSGDIGLVQLHKFAKSPFHIWLSREIEHVIKELEEENPR